MQIFDIVEELEKERKKNKELEEKIKELKKYEKAYINEVGLTHILVYRIDKAIEYIKEEEKANPDSNRKDVGLILMNYKRVLNILKGEQI